MVDRLTLTAIAPSLGGVESLVTQPITTTYHGLDPDERARRGIADSMIRLPVGLEDPPTSLPTSPRPSKPTDPPRTSGPDPMGQGRSLHPTNHGRAPRPCSPR
ncbi:PLP-dependent transferase [Nocardia sp. NPDC004123]